MGPRGQPGRLACVGGLTRADRFATIGGASGDGREAACSPQVVPTILGEMLQDQDPDKPKRVMAALMKMKKLDIDALRKAYEGRLAPAS
jgi:hypothetical protein